MTWLYSQALINLYANSHSLQVPAAEYSGENSSAGVPCVQSRSSPTLPQCYLHGKTIKRSTLSRYGITSALLTDDLGEAVLMSYLAASPAKTYQPRAKAVDCLAPGVDSGARWHASSEKCYRSSFSLRTAPSLSSEDSIPSSKTLTSSGTMRNGHVYPHANVAPLINVIAYGLSQYGEKVQWMTPTKFQAPRRSADSLAKRGKFVASLGRVRIMPGTLEAQVQLSQDLPVWDYLSDQQQDIHQVMANFHYKDGRMNPEWVEWLMGWPIGHTALTALETDKFHGWQQQHGLFCSIDLSAP